MVRVRGAWYLQAPCCPNKFAFGSASAHCACIRWFFMLIFVFYFKIFDLYFLLSALTFFAAEHSLNIKVLAVKPQQQLAVTVGMSILRTA